MTDMHGNKEALERLLEVGKEKSIEAIVIGGDLCPGFEIPEQRAFLENWLVPKLKNFTKPILLIMGNDDFSINTDILEKADKEGVLHLLHNSAVKIGKICFAGYPYVNDVPFLIRDWLKKEQEIKNDLEQIKAPRETIWLFHAPPYETKLDIAWSGEHVGSTAVKDFILKEQPLASLHGHIHESPVISGKWKERLGNTLAINPGNENIIILDIEKLEAKEI